MILCDFVKIPQSFFCSSKNDSSLYKGAYIGQPQGLSLRFYIFFNPCVQAPSDEGAVERSETEGEKAINIKFSLSLPQSFFFEKRQLPRRGSGMFNVNFNLILTDNCYIFVDFHGGCKPPPYRVEYDFTQEKSRVIAYPAFCISYFARFDVRLYLNPTVSAAFNRTCAY